MSFFNVPAHAYANPADVPAPPPAIGAPGLANHFERMEQMEAKYAEIEARGITDYDNAYEERRKLGFGGKKKKKKRKAAPVPVVELDEGPTDSDATESDEATESDDEETKQKKRKKMVKAPPKQDKCAAKCGDQISVRAHCRPRPLPRK